MTQLIVNGTTMPYVKAGGYSCRTEVLSEAVTMISGRMVEEIRGEVYVIDYAIESMAMTTYQALVNALRSGGAITCSFLPDDGSALLTSDFICTARPAPTFFMEHLSEPIWKDITFQLREVAPHD